MPLLLEEALTREEWLKGDGPRKLYTDAEPDRIGVLRIGVWERFSKKSRRLATEGRGFVSSSSGNTGDWSTAGAVAIQTSASGATRPPVTAGTAVATAIDDEEARDACSDCPVTGGLGGVLFKDDLLPDAGSVGVVVAVDVSSATSPAAATDSGKLNRAESGKSRRQGNSKGDSLPTPGVVGAS